MHLINILVKLIYGLVFYGLGNVLILFQVKCGEGTVNVKLY
jgi:hypothetical protein